MLQKELNHSRIGQTMVYNHVTEKHQHDTTLSIWNKPKESSKEMEQIQKEINLDKLTNQILRANEEGQSSLIILYQLTKEAISSLEQKGFIIKDTSPIEKLKGMYHTISW